MHIPLIASYTRTHDLILRLTADISDIESVAALPFGSNTVNWLLGHVTVARWNVLAGVLGDRSEVWSMSEAQRYISGSAPLQALDDAIAVERLRDRFTVIHGRMLGVLTLLPDAVFNTTTASGRTLAEALISYAVHEGFHAGQLELCRKFLGKPYVQSYE